MNPPRSSKGRRRATEVARSTGQGRRVMTTCDAVPPAALPPSASRLLRAIERRLDAAQQLLHGVLRRDGVDGQTGSQLQPGDLPQAGGDLPVPVVRGVDLL